MKKAKHIGQVFLPLLALALLTACGGAPETAPITQQDIFADAEGILALVIYNPTEEELVNTHVVRAFDDADNEYYDEVLIVPKFGDCKIWFESMEFDEETGAFVSTGEILGNVDGTGNEPSQPVGSVLVRTLIPEGIPNKQVLVSRNGKTGTFLLGYDGKGDGHYYIRAWEES